MSTPRKKITTRDVLSTAKSLQRQLARWVIHYPEECPMRAEHVDLHNALATFIDACSDELASEQFIRDTGLPTIQEAFEKGRKLVEGDDDAK